VTKRALIVVSGAVIVVLLFIWIARDSRSTSSASAVEADKASGPAKTQPIDLAKRRRAADKAAGDDEGTAFVTAAWGSGPGALGRDRPQEASPSGPMSFVVDERRRMWVLDQVNGRVIRYSSDGSVEDALAIAHETAQDIAVASDGTVAVLDRFRSEDVALHDPSGAFVGSLPLNGPGIETAGHVTGVFIDGTDVYAESEHGPLFKIGSTNGDPADPRTELPGRPSKDGTFYVKAGIIDAPAGRAYVAVNDRPSEEHRFTRELVMGSAIQAIVLLDTDLEGTIYFGTELVLGDPATEVMIVCLDSSNGEVQGTVTVPANDMPEETFKDFVVDPAGGVLYTLRTEEGSTYKRVDCSE